MPISRYCQFCCTRSTLFRIVRYKSTLPAYSEDYQRSHFAREIRRRFEEQQHLERRRKTRKYDALFSQIESIAAQRILTSDKERFSEIKRKFEETRSIPPTPETAKESKIVLPYKAEPQPDLLVVPEKEEAKNAKNKETATLEELLLADVDRGFFVSDGKFSDDYAAATTADLPEDDMTEPPIKYYGNMEEAVEHIEFQMPGQSTKPKGRSAPTKSELQPVEDAGDWVSNYGTVEADAKLEGELVDGLMLNDAKCAGCGAQFHCHNSSLPGFVPLELFREIERNSRKMPLHQKTDYTCRRCFLLKEYNFLLNLNICEVDYAHIMGHLKLLQEVLILLIVDMTDLEGSIHRELPKIIGGNKPLIVVGNKVDLLPPDMKRGYLRQFHKVLRKAVADAGYTDNFNILKYMLISAKTGFGVEELITTIYQKWISPRGGLRNDIYCVGATNAGKSTLFNTFIQSDLCKVRAMDLVERVTTSIWPGTTLSLLKFPLMNPSPQKLELRRRRLLTMQAWNKKEEQIRWSTYLETKDKRHAILQGIVGSTFKDREADKQPISTSDLIKQFNGEEMDAHEIEKVEGKKPNMNLNDRVFQSGRWFYDTPGTVNRQQVLDLFTLEELINVIPRTIILPRIYTLLPGQSLLLGGVACVDLLASTDCMKGGRVTPVFFTVFASRNLKVNVMYTKYIADFLRTHQGNPSLGAPIGDKQRLEKFPKLEGTSFVVENEVQGREENRGVADVVLSSLGWVLLTTDADKVKVNARTPAGRGLSIRQPPILPYAASYRGKRIVGTAQYLTRSLADVETFAETQRTLKPGKIVEKNRKASHLSGAAENHFVNFDLVN